MKDYAVQSAPRLRKVSKRVSSFSNKHGRDQTIPSQICPNIEDVVPWKILPLNYAAMIQQDIEKYRERCRQLFGHVHLTFGKMIGTLEPAFLRKKAPVP